jgi:hypothetical protein
LKDLEKTGYRRQVHLKKIKGLFIVSLKSMMSGDMKTGKGEIVAYNKTPIISNLWACTKTSTFGFITRIFCIEFS